MASSSDKATNDVISVDNTFYPLDVTQRTDGDAEADWERWLNSLQVKTINVRRIVDDELNSSRLELLNSGNLSDVTLQCGERTIPCHRVILAESSPVFKAMFITKMAEASAGDRSIEIQDVSFNVLRKVVQFIYTDEIKIDGGDLIEILQFSDMYQITCLRKACGDMMLENISVSSAVGVWKNAQKYQLKHIIQPTRNFINENFYKESNDRVGLSKGLKELDKDDLISILSDPQLVVPSEKQVFEVLWAWVIYRQERKLFLEEIFGSCIHFNALDASDVTRCLQCSDSTFVDDETSLVLYQFLRAVGTGHRPTVGTLLPVRLHTQHVPFISMVFNGRNIYVLILVPRKDNLTNAATAIFKKTPIGELTLTPAGETMMMHVEQKASDSEEEYGECEKATPISHPANTSNNRLTTIASNHQHQLLLLLPSRQVLRTLDFRAGTYHDRESTFYGHRLYRTHYGHLLGFHTTESTTLCVRRFPSETTLYPVWQAEFNISISSLDLMAAYQHYILIFEPGENRVSILDADKRCVKQYYLTLHGNSENTTITSVANVAFLVQSDVIEVVYMDRLVSQHTSSKQTLTVQSEATLNALNEQSEAPLIRVTEKSEASKELVTEQSKAAHEPIIKRYPGPGSNVRAEETATSDSDTASMSNTALTAVKASVIFGDELVVLMTRPPKDKDSDCSAEQSFEATNVNALLLLAAGERLEWKTLTLQHGDTSWQKLQGEWSHAELFSMVSDKTMSK